MQYTPLVRLTGPEVTRLQRQVWDRIQDNPLAEGEAFDIPGIVAELTGRGYATLGRIGAAEFWMVARRHLKR